MARRRIAVTAILVLVAEPPAQGDRGGSVREPATRAAAIDAGAIVDLAARLGDGDWRVRRDAARRIGEAGAAWLDERLAALLDDERVAPIAAQALARVTGQAQSWPPLERADELVEAARAWWREQRTSGEGWVTHEVALSPDRATVVRGQMHAERGTAYLVVCDAGSGLESHRAGWSGPIRSIAFSRDSRWLAASDDRGGATVLDRSRPREVRRFAGHRGWSWSVALSGDGGLLATSAKDATLRLTEVASGALRWSRAGCEAVDLEFTPDDRALVAAERSGRLLRLDVDDGHATVLAEGLSAVADLAIADDGERVALLHRDGTLAVCSASAPRALWSIAAHSPRPRTVRWSSDGARLATAGSERCVRVWSVDDGTLLHDIACERNAIALRWHDGSLVAARYDGSVQRLALETPAAGDRRPR